MEPIHGLPIKPFPRPTAVVQRQMEECEDGFINFLGSISMRAHSIGAGRPRFILREIKNCDSGQRLFRRIPPWKLSPFAFLSALYAQRTRGPSHEDAAMFRTAGITSSMNSRNERIASSCVMSPKGKEVIR